MVPRIFRWSCPSFPKTITQMMTSESSPSRVMIKLEFTKHRQWSYCSFYTGWYNITETAWRGVVRDSERVTVNIWQKNNSHIAKNLIQICSKVSPGTLQVQISLGSWLLSLCHIRRPKRNETVCLRRYLFLYGAHSAWCARMANMAVGIVLESFNKTMNLVYLY